MRTGNRTLISLLAGVTGALALVAWSGGALAQRRLRDVECRPTETQAECHTRLKCRPNEEVEACQKRLLRCTANETLEKCEQRARARGRRDRGDSGDRDRDRDRGRDGDRDTYRDRGDSGDRYRDRDTDGDRGDGYRERRGGRGGVRRGRRRSGGGGGGGFQANKTFGLGLELGEPSGLNGKYFLSDSGALDFGLGWIYDPYYFGDGFHVYADYLWHPTVLASTPAFELPLYIGVGVRFWDFRYCDRNICYGGSAAGVRVPFGIAFDFNNNPLDIFIQLVPVIDFVNGDYYNRYGDRAHFGVDLSAGIRYWFN